MKIQKFFILLCLVLPLSFGFSGAPAGDNTCPSPSNFSVTNQTSTSVSFGWSDCECDPEGYNLRYFRQEDSYASGNYQTSGTTYTFYNLPSGHYRFYLSSICIGEASTEIWVDVVQN
jgi:hypothetical protein